MPLKKASTGKESHAKAQTWQSFAEQSQGLLRDPSNASLEDFSRLVHEFFSLSLNGAPSEALRSEWLASNEILEGFDDFTAFVEDPDAKNELGVQGTVVSVHLKETLGLLFSSLLRKAVASHQLCRSSTSEVESYALLVISKVQLVTASGFLRCCGPSTEKSSLRKKMPPSKRDDSAQTVEEIFLKEIGIQQGWRSWTEIHLSVGMDRAKAVFAQNCQLDAGSQNFTLFCEDDSEMPNVFNVARCDFPWCSVISCEASDSGLRLDLDLMSISKCEEHLEGQWDWLNCWRSTVDPTARSSIFSLFLLTSDAEPIRTFVSKLIGGRRSQVAPARRRVVLASTKQLSSVAPQENPALNEARPDETAPSLLKKRKRFVVASTKPSSDPEGGSDVVENEGSVHGLEQVAQKSKQASILTTKVSTSKTVTASTGSSDRHEKTGTSQVVATLLELHASKVLTTSFLVLLQTLRKPDDAPARCSQEEVQQLDGPSQQKAAKDHSRGRRKDKGAEAKNTASPAEEAAPPIPPQQRKRSDPKADHESKSRESSADGAPHEGQRRSRRKGKGAEAKDTASPAEEAAPPIPSQQRKRSDPKADHESKSRESSADGAPHEGQRRSRRKDKGAEAKDTASPAGEAAPPIPSQQRKRSDPKADHESKSRDSSADGAPVEGQRRSRRKDKGTEAKDTASPAEEAAPPIPSQQRKRFDPKADHESKSRDSSADGAPVEGQRRSRRKDKGTEAKDTASPAEEAAPPIPSQQRKRFDPKADHESKSRDSSADGAPVEGQRRSRRKDKGAEAKDTASPAEEAAPPIPPQQRKRSDPKADHESKPRDSSEDGAPDEGQRRSRRKDKGTDPELQSSEDRPVEDVPSEEVGPSSSAEGLNQIGNLASAAGVTEKKAAPPSLLKRKKKDLSEAPKDLAPTQKKDSVNRSDAQTSLLKRPSRRTSQAAEEAAPTTEKADQSPFRRASVPSVTGFMILQEFDEAVDDIFGKPYRRSLDGRKEKSSPLESRKSKKKSPPRESRKSKGASSPLQLYKKQSIESPLVKPEKPKWQFSFPRQRGKGEKRDLLALPLRDVEILTEEGPSANGFDFLGLVEIKEIQEAPLQTPASVTLGENDLSRLFSLNIGDLKMPAVEQKSPVSKARRPFGKRQKESQVDVDLGETDIELGCFGSEASLDDSVSFGQEHVSEESVPTTRKRKSLPGEDCNLEELIVSTAVQ
uniref:Uncharacterized protein n=1 Tax=Chromera velia CCMP2878 TaxID=1169474 RepID=A0A0G4HTN9_9ALVE|eukprot:Cvel_8504.t1-p1 / transcript=Cvel_8504.t1 / gene=Cvel_8504 / organism=Chromera_velia_CCMP2878 / gene_product=Protein starmaker, putative / transcript_product=Protein starmaker, putative / location=Cvel_scaffold470:50949-55736(-) / protein_length=1210 / sequence_SO=supercontig / SO=protein_coding / is_pseudo=false